MVQSSGGGKSKKCHFIYSLSPKMLLYLVKRPFPNLLNKKLLLSWFESLTPYITTGFGVLPGVKYKTVQFLPSVKAVFGPLDSKKSPFPSFLGGIRGSTNQISAEGYPFPSLRLLSDLLLSIKSIKKGKAYFGAMRKISGSHPVPLVGTYGGACQCSPCSLNRNIGRQTWATVPVLNQSVQASTISVITVPFQA